MTESIQFNAAIIDELNLLLKFPESSMEGLKIHHSAEASMVEAAQRLHAKGLTSHSDGGYLTELGREAAQSANLLISLLTPR